LGAHKWPYATSSSRPVGVFHVGENVVHRLEAGEAGVIDLTAENLIVQCLKPEQVGFDPLAGVIGVRAAVEDERPVAGLGQEQFPRSLLE
jgi:hypothetical protein